jgi:hypothetical protein
MTSGDDRKLRDEDVAGMEVRGVEAARMLVTRLDAPAESSAMDGLLATDGRRIRRGDAEWWVRQQDKKRAEAAARFNRRMLRLGIIAAVAGVVAALAAILAVREGWPTTGWVARLFGG